MLTIVPSGQLYQITFSHPDRAQFMVLVDCMKEIGAEWDKRARCWVLVERKRVDILNKCKSFSGDPAELLESLRREKNKLIGLPELVQPVAPTGMIPMPHQEDGVRFIADREGSLLAWQVGCGKTLAAMGSINAAGPDGYPALIICPAHLKRNWYSEFKGDPDLSRKGWLVDRTKTVGIAQGNYFPPTDIVIINYDILDRHKQILDSTPWAFAIVDESHFIKSPKAKRTKAIVGGTKGRGKDGQKWQPLHAKRRIALSATPLVNKPEDVWAVCNWLDPKRWPSKYWFEQRFCIIREREQWTKKKDPITGLLVPVKRNIRQIISPADPGLTPEEEAEAHRKLEALNRRLTGTIMSRIRSKDVLDLPPKTRRVIEIEIPSASGAISAERKALASKKSQADSLRAAIEVSKVSGTEAEYRDAIEALKQFQNEEKEHIAILRKKVSMAKVPYVVDHVRNILLDPERKVLVFAHHHQVIESLVNDFRDTLPDGVVHFYGKSTHQEKEDAEKRIQSDPTCRVFIGGITAAGTGLTLTGASHVVFAEEDWVPANMVQCEGRAWRKGQTDSVLIEHVVAYGSVDSLIAKRMVAKQEVADRAIDSDLTLSEPIDWIEDHRLPTEEELDKDITPYQRTTGAYGLKQIVKSPNLYGVTDLDLIIASRLSTRKLEGKAAAYASHLCKKYLGASHEAPVELPDRG